MFAFLEDFYDDSQITVSEAYKLKVELRLILDALPEFQEKEKSDYTRLLENHKQEIEQLKIDVEKLYSLSYDLLSESNLSESAEKCEKISQYLKMYQDLKERSDTSMNRDVMMKREVIKFPQLNDIRWILNNLHPFWTIAEKMNIDAERWMSVTFPELSPDKILAETDKWGKTLESIREPLLAKYPDCNCNKGITELIASIQGYVYHIPITTLFRSRGRHWIQISNLTGLQISPNEGLTWHWIIESGLEEHLAEIMAITRTAACEFKVEKALNSMINEINNTKIGFTQYPTVQLGDVRPVFDMLSRHREIIQRLFVPPYVTPFALKLKDYEMATANIKTIITKTMTAQSSVNKIAPAMESADIKEKEKEVSDNYGNTIEQFESVIKQFGSPESFMELIANPRYSSQLDAIQNSVGTLKENLHQIIEKKRAIFPFFHIQMNFHKLQIFSIIYILKLKKQFLMVMFVLDLLELMEKLLIL